MGIRLMIRIEEMAIERGGPLAGVVTFVMVFLVQDAGEKTRS